MVAECEQEDGISARGLALSFLMPLRSRRLNVVRLEGLIHLAFASKAGRRNIGAPQWVESPVKVEHGDARVR